MGLDTLIMAAAFMVIGQTAFPHRFLPPRQYMQIEENFPLTDTPLSSSLLFIVSGMI
jgi:hypothetical protein